MAARRALTGRELEVCLEMLWSSAHLLSLAPPLPRLPQERAGRVGWHRTGGRRHAARAAGGACGVCWGAGGRGRWPQRSTQALWLQHLLRRCCVCFNHSAVAPASLPPSLARSL